MTRKCDDQDHQPRILCLAPCPPPYAGPEVMTRMLLSAPELERFALLHLPSNVNTDNVAKGKIQIRTLLRFGKYLVRIVANIIRHNPSVTYLLLNQNVTGCARDAVLIVLAAIARTRIVLHFHGANFHSFYFRQAPFVRAVIRAVLRCVDAMIVVGPSIGKRIEALRLGVPIHIVRNCVDSSQLPATFDSLALSRADNSRPARILYVGLLSRAKGLETLLKAIPHVLEQLPDAHFRIFGDLVLKERNIIEDENGVSLSTESVEPLIRTTVERFSGNVHFLGRLTPVVKWTEYLESDVFVLPTYSDSLPLVILDAMAVGLPVVTCPVGAIPDNFDEGTHVRYVQPGNFVQLAEVLTELVQDPEQRARMGRANFEHVRRGLTPGHSADSLARVFDTVLEMEGPRGIS